MPTTPGDSDTEDPVTFTEDHAVVTWEVTHQLMQATRAAQQSAELCHLLDLVKLHPDRSDESAASAHAGNAVELPTDEQGDEAIDAAIRAEQNALNALRRAKETLAEESAETGSTRD